MSVAEVDFADLSPGDQAKFLRAIKHDPLDSGKLWRWCEVAGVKIIDKDDPTQLVTMRPRFAQKYVWGVKDELARAGELVRLAILKARQEGMTTGFAVENLHIGSTTKLREIYMLMHDLQPASKVYKKLDVAMEHMHPLLKPGIESYETGRRLTFDTKSTLLIESVNKQGTGRSETIHHLHATELPSWDNAKTVLDGIEESVPDAPGGKSSIVLESTAEGVGDYWYWIVMKARNGEGQYRLVFLPWWLEPFYRRRPEPGELKRSPITREEEQIAKRICIEAPLYGMPVPSNAELVAMLMWRRRKIENRTVDTFRQEYPATIDEAFVGSGKPVFNGVSAQFHRTRMFDDKPVVCDAPLRMEVVQIGVGRNKLGQERPIMQWKQRDDGELHIWEPPVAGERYIIGGDSASGEAEDYSALQVIKLLDHGGWEQVAVWYGKCGTKALAAIMQFLAIKYGNALMVPENNGVGAAVVDALLHDYRRQGQRLYQYERINQETRKMEPRYGFSTQGTNRPAVIEDFDAQVRGDKIIIHHAQTMLELEQFTFDKKTRKPQAPSGGHDDLLMSIMLASYVRSIAPMPKKVDIKVVPGMQGRVRSGGIKRVDTGISARGVRPPLHRGR